MYSAQVRIVFCHLLDNEFEFGSIGDEEDRSGYVELLDEMGNHNIYCSSLHAPKQFLLGLELHQSDALLPPGSINTFLNADQHIHHEPLSGRVFFLLDLFLSNLQSRLLLLGFGQ